MTLPIPVIGQLIDSVGNVVNSGFEILGDLVRGHMDRQERKSALEELKIKADEARKNLELEVNLDIKTREANLRILQGMMEIIQDVVRTDVELKLIAKGAKVKNNLMVMNWQKSTTVELVQLRSEILDCMNKYLNSAQSLPEIEKAILIDGVSRVFNGSLQMTFDYNASVRTQAESLLLYINEKEIDEELKETLERLAGMDTLNLLDEYPEDEDK